MSKTNLYSTLEVSEETTAIKDEIYLTDNYPSVMSIDYPHKNDFTITCVCAKGEINGNINLASVNVKAPGMLVLLPDQIVQFEKPSEDFEGFFIIMTKQFLEKINLLDGVSVFLSILNTPYVPLNDLMLNGLKDYHRMVMDVIHNTEDDFNQKMIVNHLTIAFFYGMGYYLHKQTEKNRKPRMEIIVDEFLKLVQKHYKNHSELKFYAGKLCLTTKYLAASVKNGSGRTPRQWVDDYVILEAKTLLKSSDFTVQQIADELNFPSQSFFGKFFKREVGVSPKQYKDMK